MIEGLFWGNTGVIWRYVGVDSLLQEVCIPLPAAAGHIWVQLESYARASSFAAKAYKPKNFPLW